MCFDPLSATAIAAMTFATSAATSVVGFADKQNQADAQTARYNQNYQNSLAAARDNQVQSTKRMMQEESAYKQRDHLHLLEGAKKEAQIAVSAAGGNVSGLSVDNLVADAQSVTNLNRTTLRKNWADTASQLQTAAEADAVNKTQSRINSVNPGSDPNPLGLGLELAGAGMKSYSDYKKAS